MTDSDLTSQYDAAAPGWSARLERFGYLSAYCDLIERAVPPGRTADRVCDIGTGSGAFAQAYMRSRGAPGSLTLLDSSPQMLKTAATLLARHGADLARHGADLTCHCTSLETFEPQQPYQLVLGADVLEHCHDPGQSLRTLWRLVAPGGQLLLVISRPHWCQWLIWLRWRHRWFSQVALGGIAAEAGLPPPDICPFAAGPPRRTSLGYVFNKHPTDKE